PPRPRRRRRHRARGDGAGRRGAPAGGDGRTDRRNPEPPRRHATVQNPLRSRHLMPPLTARRLVLSLGLLAVILLLGVAVCASIGSSHYTLLDLVRTIPDRELATTTVLRVRLPRLLMAALAGAALGASGAAFQAVR